jgi:hypothetical protein
VTHSNPPSPFRLDAGEDEHRTQEAASIDPDLAEIRRTGTYPCVFQGIIRIDGEPVAVEIQLYSGPGRLPVTRWMRRSRKLTAAESGAIRARLLREMQFDAS